MINNNIWKKIAYLPSIIAKNGIVVTNNTIEDALLLIYFHTMPCTHLLIWWLFLDCCNEAQFAQLNMQL